MLLSDVFSENAIKIGMESETKEEAIEELIETITEANPSLDRNLIREGVLEREEKMNTAIVPGVAIPHGEYPGVTDVVGAIGISRKGIDYDTEDRQPVHVVFLLVLGDGSREKHLRVLNSVASLIKSGAVERFDGAANSGAVASILKEI